MLSGGGYKPGAYNRIMKKILIFLILLLASCDASRDFLSMTPPSVKKVEIREQRCVMIFFSCDMEKSLTEKAFVMKKNREKTEGSFTWEGNVLCYSPLGGIRERCSYLIEISAMAEDTLGNSLVKDFVYSFSTKEKECGFCVESAGFNGGNAEFTFSSPVDRGSLYGTFSIFPSADGSLVFRDDDSSVSFVPYRELTAGTAYTVSMEQQLCDIYGNALREKYEFVFSVPTEEEVSLVRIETASGNSPEQMEKDDALVLVFSGPADRAAVRKSISISPYTSFSCRWNSSNTECRIGFDRPLVYGSRLDIKVLDESFVLFVKGENSVPPTVESISYYDNYTAGSIIPLSYGGSMIFESTEKGCFEFEFSTAPTASVIMADFLQNLEIRVTSGDMRVKLLRAENRSSPGKNIIRVYCSITAGTKSSVLSFIVDGDFSDSLGNKLGEDFVMRINSL